MPTSTIHIRLASFPSDRPAICVLLREYAAALRPELRSQEFTGEMEGLPENYVEPNGRMLVAWQDDKAVGCVALRPMERDTCEMKRLYVQHGARGSRIGRRLVERICIEAREAGYRRMRLATLGSMEAALQLYTSLGFQPVQPFLDPLPGSVFLEREL